MVRGIRELLVDELEDILSAEEQIVHALPEVIKAAYTDELREALTTHLKETREQVKRLDKIFKLLHVTKRAKLCKAMQGLIEECQEVLTDWTTASALRDAALIAKLQRIEHYEIAAYGTTRTFANELDLDDVADLLDDSLDEEANADKVLTKVAQGGLFTSGVNQQSR